MVNNKQLLGIARRNNLSNRQDQLDMRRILQLSSSAACAPDERVITVKRENAARIRNKLRDEGFNTEITMPEDARIRKIFFSRLGL